MGLAFPLTTLFESIIITFLQVDDVDIYYDVPEKEYRYQGPGPHRGTHYRSTTLGPTVDHFSLDPCLTVAGWKG